MTRLPECTPEAVAEACEKLGFALSEPVSSLLADYLVLLEQWNRVMNLVGPGAWPDILRTLVADSFFLADFLRELPLGPEPECWDLGAGAGLPGIPLRMIWQRGSYALVESRDKRAGFLQTVLARCPLPGTFAHHGRVETFMPGRPLADLVVSRAFLPWEKVLALVGGRLAPRGIVVFLSLVPLPAVLPPGWTAAGGKEYTVAGQTRYFWGLTPVI